MKELVWKKKGLIYKTSDDVWFSKTHAQVPVVLKLAKSELFRVFFATRDIDGKSRVSYVDLSSKDPKYLVKVADSPVLDLGRKGTFDDSGVMPSWVLEKDGKIYLYYIGWNVRNTIPYHNSVGLAVSDDGGNSFERVSEGPMMDRTRTEPFFAGSSCVLVENGLWRNWYLSCTDWREVNGRMEPRYHLKYAESSNGLDWARKGVVAIDYKSEQEAGIVKASVVKRSKGYHMWYSYRNFSNYRTDPNQSYKIGYASSEDGIKWVRNDEAVGISLSEKGWDSQMMAYPHVIEHEGKLLMFYNGNGFGQHGFGYAERDISSLSSALFDSMN